MGFGGGLVLGILIGLAVGVVTIGFLAISAYERGLAEAAGKRKEWKAELVARRAAVRAMPRVATSAPIAAAPIAAAPAPPAVAPVAAVAARKAS
ncbi:MAG: hypothetical protein KGN00_09200 [Chloroflexota bacterium]|nr:hypothetical protein [Chloroflexota bacterium]